MPLQSYTFGQDPKYTDTRKYLGAVIGVHPFTVVAQTETVSTTV